jgi:hypothetical protein
VDNSAFGDVTKPEISNVRVTTTGTGNSLHAGDTVTLWADITDASGISNVRLDLFNPNNYGYWTTVAKSSGNTYSFTFTIPENPWPGEWYFWYIEATDASEHGNSVSQSVSHLKFSVDNSAFGDVTKPEISNVRVTTTGTGESLYAGDTVTLWADITDASGLSNVRLDLFNPNNYGYWTTVAKSSGDTYSFSFTIPENPWPGEWCFWYIEATDASENGNSVSQSVSHLKFSVAATPPTDITPPTISGISVVPVQNNPDDAVTVSAVITDDVTVHHAFYALISPSDIEYNNNILTKNSETDIWIGSRTLPPDAEPGIWSIEITAYDTANNISKQTLSNAFTVSVPFIQVTGVSLSKQSVDLQIGQTAALSATVSPDNATNKNIEWSSDKPGIATVDQNGTVTAVGEGKATITVRTLNGNYTKTCIVTISKPAAVSDLDHSEAVSIKNNKTIKINITNAVFNGKARSVKLTVLHNGKVLAKGTDYKITYKNNVKVGKATATVTGIGKYTGTKIVTFKILPKSTSISKLTPAKKQLKVTWKKTVGTTKYEVRYKVKNAKSWSKPKSVSGKSTSITIKKLIKSKIYQVQIRSYRTVAKVKYYSAWSKTKTSNKIK